MMRRFSVTICIPEAVYRAGVKVLLLGRRLRYGYAFRKIPLTRGMFAKVDQADYERLAMYKWYATSARNRGEKIYAERSEGGRKTKRNILMHREIMLQVNPKFEYLNPKPVLRPKDGTTEGRQIQITKTPNSKRKSELYVDHINGDGLDNRRANLRAATPKQNVWNSRGYGRSKYKGIWLDKSSGKWCARIKVGDKVRNLGRYVDEETAARAYDAAARGVHKEFARLNFPGVK